MYERCHTCTGLTRQVYTLEVCVQRGHTKVMHALDELNGAQKVKIRQSESLESQWSPGHPKSWHLIVSQDVSHRYWIDMTGLYITDMCPKRPYQGPTYFGWPKTELMKSKYACFSVRSYDCIVSPNYNMWCHGRCHTGTELPWWVNEVNICAQRLY